LNFGDPEKRSQYCN